MTGNLCHGVQMQGTGAGSSLPAATNIVRGNVIRGNGCAGPHLFQHALENTVEGNSVAGNAGGGVFLESTGPINSPRNNVLRWNVVQGNRGDGVTETGFSNTMVGNVITTNGLDGVHIRATLAAITGSRVEANQIRGNGRNGVLVDPFRLGNQVLGNTALGNAAFDLADENAQCRGAIWAGNTFGTRNQPCIG